MHKKACNLSVDNSFRLIINFEQCWIYLGEIQIVIEICLVKTLPILSSRFSLQLFLCDTFPEKPVAFDKHKMR